MPYHISADEITSEINFRQLKNLLKLSFLAANKTGYLASTINLNTSHHSIQQNAFTRYSQGIITSSSNQSTVYPNYLNNKLTFVKRFERSSNIYDNNNTSPSILSEFANSLTQNITNIFEYNNSILGSTNNPTYNFLDGTTSATSIYNSGNTTLLSSHIKNETKGQQSSSNQQSKLITLFVAIYISIMIAGVLGNLSTCLVVWRNRYMHTPTNFYLISLAISDLLVLTFGLPAEIVSLYDPNFSYNSGDAFCITRSIVSEASYNASVLTITAFTAERFLAIYYPMKRLRLARLSRALKIILLIWFLAIICALPIGTQMGVLYHVNDDGVPIKASAQCTIKRNKIIIKYAFTFVFIVLFLIPLILIAILYTMIGCRVRTFSQHKRISQHYENSSTWFGGKNSSWRIMSKQSSNTPCAKKPSQTVVKNKNMFSNYVVAPFFSKIISHSKTIPEIQVQENSTSAARDSYGNRSQSMPFNNSTNNKNKKKIIIVKQKSETTMPRSLSKSKQIPISSTNMDDVNQENVVDSSHKVVQYTPTHKNVFRLFRKPDAVINEKIETPSQLCLLKYNIDDTNNNNLASYDNNSKDINGVQSTKNVAKTPVTQSIGKSVMIKNDTLGMSSNSNPYSLPFGNNSSANNSPNLNSMDKHQKPNRTHARPLLATLREMALNKNYSFNTSTFDQSFDSIFPYQNVKIHNKKMQSPSIYNDKKFLYNRNANARKFTFGSNNRIKSNVSEDGDAFKDYDMNDYDRASNATTTMSPSVKTFIKNFKDSYSTISKHYKSHGTMYKAKAYNRKTILKMLIAVVICFFICYAPNQAQRLHFSYVRYWNEQRLKEFKVLFYISGILFYVSATINPIIYNVISLKYRRALKYTLLDCLYQLCRLVSFLMSLCDFRDKVFHCKAGKSFFSVGTTKTTTSSLYHHNNNYNYQYPFNNPNNHQHSLSNMNELTLVKQQPVINDKNVIDGTTCNSNFVKNFFKFSNHRDNNDNKNNNYNIIVMPSISNAPSKGAMIPHTILSNVIEEST